MSRSQLLDAGATPKAIEWRLSCGRLYVAHRGVYLVGHRAPGGRAEEMAAVLACGTGTVISHRSGACMWSLPVDCEPDEVEVTVVGSRSPDRPGIHARRTGALDDSEVRVLDGVPVTAPARTLLDLAPVVGPSTLELAVAEAQVRRLATRAAIRRQLELRPRRAGVAALRSIIDLEGGPAWTRSRAEREMLALVRDAQLPRPTVNARVGAYQVDFLWPRQRVIVEVDGYAYHGNRRAFERDRERDAALAARGYVVLRVTWRQLARSRESTAARLAAALAVRA